MIKVKDLTVEEKLRLLCGDGFWNIPDLDGKIPKIFMSDGPVGVRKVDYVDERGWQIAFPSVAYPSIQVLANTWSRDCARAMGESLADDCLDMDVDILLAPGVNIKRDPTNGRNFEYFSEDPYLAGTMAREYVLGVQSGGVGVCVKHFCANNLEYNRLNQTSDVDERVLREIYYKPFEIACTADPVSIMCSYNLINGVPGSEYAKGYRVLREEFGFGGIIISDWGAVHDRVKSAKAGLDLEMPYDDGRYQRLCADYKAGKITEAEIDVLVERILKTVYRLQEMRAGKSAKRTQIERLQTAQKIAEEGIVLLKNDGVLPIVAGTKVSACGCYAAPEAGWVSGGGSAQGRWLNEPFNVVDLLSEKLGAPVAYHTAFRPNEVDSFRENTAIAVKNAALSDVNIVFVGTGGAVEHEGGDREHIKLHEVQVQAILETAEENENTVVVIFAGSAIDTSDWEDSVAAIVYAGFPGEMGGEAIANVLTGKVNPSGKLSETFPVRLEDVPAYNAYRSVQVTRYAEGLNVGYRYYDMYGVQTAYPFGYGLSYSEFEYDNLHVEKKDGKVYLTFEIENVSDLDGKEVAQVYVREIMPVVYRPEKELKGYEKVAIGARERKTVQIVLDESAFAFYSTAEDCWKVQGGLYEILIGASCEDIRLAVKLEI